VFKLLHDRERGLATPELAYCPRCDKVQPTTDNGETCAVCKLVLP